MTPIEAMAKAMFLASYPWPWDIAPEDKRIYFLRMAKLSRDALANNVTTEMCEAAWTYEGNVRDEIAAAIRAAGEG